MTLTAGFHLGPYEILSPLGAGGMGEVYRARDTKLGRDVAIKVLPDLFANDPERLARFVREAQVLASLNHPNIAHVHGLEDSGGVRALVMELVDGMTVADRIARGPIPLADALSIASQVADALAAAHEQGIVHRDLKPANIKVKDNGTVKVLDFGLAKLSETTNAAAAVGLSQTPTITSPAMVTGVGSLLGTAAYMSPEQARGRAADQRSDVWAFGCVLFEMLTGRRAFEGEDVSDTLAAVLRGDPDLTIVPSGTPPSVRRLLRRTLKKDARQRLSDIRDARIEIEDAGADAEGPVASSAARATWLAWGAFTAAAVAAGVLAIPAVRYLRETTPAEMRVEINTPSTPAPLHFALSPDDKYIVLVASGDGPQRLWLRPLDKTDAQPLTGTEGAEYPFWSADSHSIGFFATGKLHRLDLGGAAPQVLADAPQGRGGTWNADGTILFGASAVSPLFRIPASGGDAVAVTSLDIHTPGSHRWPQFLPDGRHFLFYDQSTLETAGIYLASLDGGVPKRLSTADTGGTFLPPDRIVFVRQGALVARRLDLTRGELTGAAVTLADAVAYDGPFNLGGFSVSGTGRVAFRSAAAGRLQLMWYDRGGKALGKVVMPEASGLLYPELSPDGRQLAVTRTIQNNVDIWLMDLLRGGLTRVTTDPAIDNSAVWSADGKRIVFASDRFRSDRGGQYNLYVAPTNGGGAAELLYGSLKFKIPQDWSKDGRFLLYFENDPKTGRDLLALDLAAKSPQPLAVANTAFEESLAQFSPDVRWVAYQTNESGRFEIVVQAFPEPHGKWPVSTNGGIEPRWSADGKELYFIAPDGKLMAAAVTASSTTFETRTPAALFSTRIAGGAANLFRSQYAVSRDGRFLINQLADESASTPITLILNWKPGQEK